jgi:hypothetical protein
MDIGDKARRLERKLARTVEAAIGELVGQADAAPLEIVHAVLAHAEHQVIATGRGRRAFPFTRVTVRVLAPSRDQALRARLNAVFDGPPSLKERLAERLRAGGVDATVDAVTIAFSAKALPGWTHKDFNVEYERAPIAPAPPPPAAPAVAAPPRVKIAVRNGTAAHDAYTFSQSRIDLGRRLEVVNAKHEVVRTNDVAFADDESEVNRTVSRRHAHILWTGNELRICDDRSAHGTRLVREGRTVPVPAGSRGVRLRSGDEILLGNARLRVTF